MRVVETGASRSASWLVSAFPQKHHHARMNTVTQSPESAKPFFATFDEIRRVLEWPVEPLCFSPEGRAFFSRFVADCQDEVEVLSLKLSDRLGPLCGDIDADLAHDCHGLGADGAGMRTGRINFIKFTGLVPKKRLGHLTPGRVTRADNEYAFLAHAHYMIGLLHYEATRSCWSAVKQVLHRSNLAFFGRTTILLMRAVMVTGSAIIAACS